MDNTKKDRNNTAVIRKIVDALMCILLMLLMAYQVTGQALHEWIGMGMTLTWIIHHVLNRKWYSALTRGRYNAYRIVSTVINSLLIISIVLTAFCGMSMSGHAVPFMYGLAKVSFVRPMHLAMSQWSFVLMGIHLGLHVTVMTAGLKINERARRIISGVMTLAAGYGLYLFLKNDMTGYLLFRSKFAMLDYDKPGALVILESIMMMLFWVFAGAQTFNICKALSAKKKDREDTDKNALVIPAALLAAALIIGFAANAAFGSNDADAGWDAATGNEADAPEEATADAADDGFVLIGGGSFDMGSPENENWRSDDETQHEVRVSSFYMDPYETTQEDYTRVMGDNPSTFSGDRLPVDNISWLDAVNYANARSIEAGLTPAYTVSEGNVSWDRSADGYRLPTEAEWEYACRAGTATPFNTEKSLSADEANFYGHYPYEIEENYFDSSDLEAQPGEYRDETIAVGSFAANKWGLYDMHGNVNEWCWDYYGEYDTANADDPAGPADGTRRVYRGGGWNDFAKNMRSAYRAAGPASMTSYNLGVRLVRNAGEGISDTLTVSEKVTDSTKSGKVLIAFFSWGGNTRGIAKEIQKQTGADIVELTPVKPYSKDYDTVLMEAQEDQHNQSRPELNEHVDNMDEYDTILLGYPNWWASIPMPIATFLEEYDFSGKKIVPFCSHGGGRFGQSITAIAKLAPDAVIGEGLAVHYSGGSEMPDDVSEWLSMNSVK